MAAAVGELRRVGRLGLGHALGPALRLRGADVHEQHVAVRRASPAAVRSGTASRIGTVTSSMASTRTGGEGLERPARTHGGTDTLPVS